VLVCDSSTRTLEFVGPYRAGIVVDVELDVADVELDDVVVDVELDVAVVGVEVVEVGVVEVLEVVVGEGTRT
jgi:hypothetical protein